MKNKKKLKAKKYRYDRKAILESLDKVKTRLKDMKEKLGKVEFAFNLLGHSKAAVQLQMLKIEADNSLTDVRWSIRELSGRTINPYD